MDRDDPWYASGNPERWIGGPGDTVPLGKDYKKRQGVHPLLPDGESNPGAFDPDDLYEQELQREQKAEVDTRATLIHQRGRAAQNWPHSLVGDLWSYLNQGVKYPWKFGPTAWTRLIEILPDHRLLRTIRDIDDLEVSIHTGSKPENQHFSHHWRQRDTSISVGSSSIKCNAPAQHGQVLSATSITCSTRGR